MERSVRYCSDLLEWSRGQHEGWGDPEFNKKFCDRCGAASIIACQKCNAHIPGEYLVRFKIHPSFSVPPYCSNCGAPYPWTESDLQALRELTSALEGLNEEEKAVLAKDLDDLIVDTPRTTVAATRWKKALAKIGKEAAHALREILIDIASETARKQLGL